MSVKGYFIQYKFIIPSNIKHSSYNYQKLFRALYGYSQTVTKSNGKTYNYMRHGVLSKSPYIKQGKNCVIIQPNQFQELINFFKTGRNPAHAWITKGDWKAVYYLNEKDLEEEHVVKALEDWVDRTYITTPSNEFSQLHSELEKMKNSVIAGEKLNQTHQKNVIEAAQKIINSYWFKQVYNKSPKLKQFYSIYSSLKE
ncbi:MAG: hypothetical protein AB1467_04815 [Candidatus Diapherotrites archaeon]